MGLHQDCHAGTPLTIELRLFTHCFVNTLDGLGERCTDLLLGDVLLALRGEPLLMLPAFVSLRQDVYKLLVEVVPKDLADLIASVDAGKITYDGEKAAECIATMKTSSCSDEEPAACDEVWQGNAAPGGECTRDEECAAGYCDESQGCPGACTAYKQAGEACTFDDICTIGYDCIDDLCKAQPEIVDGAPCEAFDRCAGISVCVADKEGVETGTCQSRLSLFRLGEGAECDITQYQDSYSGFVKHDVALCKPGLSCVVESTDLANGTAVSSCQKALASGAECGYGAPDPCPSDEYCTADPTADKLSGTCTKLPLEGEPCLDLQTVQAKCGPSLQCEDNNICTPPKVLGDSCTQNKDCVSGHCDDQSGTCALRPECS